MGITLPTATMLMEVGRSAPFSGSVLQLGRQDISFTEQELQAVARRLDFHLLSTPAESPAPCQSLPGARMVMSDGAFFRWIGFEHVASLDRSDCEDASILFDLNLPDMPPGIAGRFDMVFDGGTLEHVFHLPNALKNITALLKPGGIVVHVSPANNFFNHGFYCFSPTYFHDFYQANRFETLTSQLVRFKAGGDVNRAQRVLLLPPQKHVEELARVGSLDGRSYLLFFAARRTAESDGGIVPQQSAYTEVWFGRARTQEKPAEKPLFAKLARKLARKNRRLSAIYSRLDAQLRARAVCWEDL